MGQKYDDTAQLYAPYFIGIDSQSIIYRLEQCLELYKESSSMLVANRNLLAPKPPRSMLTESPCEKSQQVLLLREFAARSDGKKGEEEGRALR